VRRWLPFLAVFGLLLSPSAPRADLSAADFELIAQSLGFREGAPASQREFGILVVPSNPASLREAADIEALLAGSLTVGGQRLTVRLMEIGEVARSPNLAGLFISEVNADQYDSIAQALAGVPVLSIGNDPTCALSGACVLSARAGRKNEIILNKKRADDANIQFGTAFRLIVREI